MSKRKKKKRDDRNQHGGVATAAPPRKGKKAKRTEARKKAELEDQIRRVKRRGANEHDAQLKALLAARRNFD